VSCFRNEATARNTCPTTSDDQGRAARDHEGTPATSSDLVAARAKALALLSHQDGEDITSAQRNVTLD